MTVALDLSDDERRLLVHGLLKWTGAARMTERIAALAWFETVDHFLAKQDDLIAGVDSQTGLETREWHQVLMLTELAFVSVTNGAGGDWFIVTGISDSESITLIRSIQHRVKQLKPWPKPFARPGSTTDPAASG